jgi:hypothetical protein
MIERKSFGDKGLGMVQGCNILGRGVEVAPSGDDGVVMGNGFVLRLGRKSTESRSTRRGNRR